MPRTLNVATAMNTPIVAYYVDATNGSDSNGGRNARDPWQTISKVNAASFSAGDKILFKRGETWTEQLYPPSAGTSGNPITFSSYGSGAKPIIHAPDTEAQSVDIRVDYITIDNLHIIAPWKVDEGYGILVQSNANNTIIQNTEIVGDQDEEVYRGIRTKDGPITINNCVIHDFEGGIAVQEGAYVVTITNNKIYDLNVGRTGELDAIVLYNAGVVDRSGSVISGNEIYGFGEDGIDCFSSGVIIENNYFHDPNDLLGNVMAIKIQTLCTGTVIRYNKIENMIASGWCLGMHVGGEAEIYYNLITSPDDIGILLYCDGDYNTVADVYNNVVYDAPLGISGEPAGGGTITANVRNNIADGSDDDMLFDVSEGEGVAITGGYNCLVNDAAVNTANGATYSGDSDDLGSTNPVYVGDPDFHLQVGSPCRNAGTDVSLTEDYDGVTVPQETNPAIGAYEYVA